MPSSSMNAVSTVSAVTSLHLEHPCTARIAFRSTNHPCMVGTVYTRVRNAVTFRSWKLLQVNLTNSHLIKKRIDFAFSFLTLLTVKMCWKYMFCQLSSLSLSANTTKYKLRENSLHISRDSSEMLWILCQLTQERKSSMQPWPSCWAKPG